MGITKKISSIFNEVYVKPDTLSLSERNKIKYRQNLEENRKIHRLNYYKRKDDPLEKKKVSERQMRRVRENPAYALKHLYYAQYIKYLKRFDTKYFKVTPFRQMVGYNIDDLRDHLSSQFREGMTIENHGKIWQIDHIRPVCSFIFNPEDKGEFIKNVKECWSLDNLRPLFKDENRYLGKY